MKKINLAFLIVMVLLCVAGAVHVGIQYYLITISPYTGVPAWVAFFFFLPYAVAVLALGIAWLVVFLVKRKKGDSA